MSEIFTIGGRQVGAGHPCFIIAEAGVNHNGDPGIAEELIDAAKAAGADAVKFQTFRTEDLIRGDTDKASYQKETTGASGSQDEMLRKLELPPAAFRALKEHADAREILFLSSPFDLGSVDLLEGIEVPAYKVASGEITNIPLLERIASTAKSVILSTGMATLSEIEEALIVLRNGGTTEIALLHAVSNYPASAGDLNLRAMVTLREAFHLPVGFSDHTLGLWAPVAAVALGASVLEKHLTLDRSMAGPDHRASLTPEGFREMVTSVRLTETALGDGMKRPTENEREMRMLMRKSLVAAVEIPEGAIILPGMLVAKRPATGIPPKYLPLFSGRRALRRIPKNGIIDWTMVG